MFKRLKEFTKFVFSLAKTNGRLLWGMWKLTRFPQPAITFFGGSRVGKNTIAAKTAFKLAKKLTEEGFSIITGGGPGIMASANQGAYEVAREYGIKNKRKRTKFTSLGITLTSFGRERLNQYIHDGIVMDHFFTRKWLLIRYSIGFIVFPGGFGTLDELFEIVTLEQCYQMPKMPIILMNVEYWEPLIDWMKNRALKEGLIDDKDLDLIHVTDSVDEAFDIIIKYCKGRCEIKNPLYSR
jgi:uncharacterized protein (TIGR00730 family)